MMYWWMRHNQAALDHPMYLQHSPVGSIAYYISGNPNGPLAISYYTSWTIQPD